MAERLSAPGVAMNSSVQVPRAEDDYVGIGPRLLAYLVDSVLLFGFIMVFATIGFMIIFMGSDAGRATITASQERGLLLSILATVPVWYAFNVGLMSMRGHTVGQYVMGLRVAPETGGPLKPRRVALYWVALHPLLFHPLLVMTWLLFAAMGIAVAGSQAVFVLAMAVAILSVVAPLANLVFMAIDRQRRGIHDRLAALKLVRLQP